MQTLRAIDSLRKQFFFLLKDTGLVDFDAENFNNSKPDGHLIRAVICAGLFPGICSVVVSYVFLILIPPCFSFLLESCNSLGYCFLGQFEVPMGKINDYINFMKLPDL